MRQQRPQPTPPSIAKEWRQFETPGGHCGVCGDWGVIDTRDFIRTPKGERAGILCYCICPHGQHHKESDTDLDLLSRNMKALVPGLRHGPWGGNMPVIS